MQCAELVPRALAGEAARRAAVQEVSGLETVVEDDEVEVRADAGRVIDRAHFDALLADARAGALAAPASRSWRSGRMVPSAWRMACVRPRAIVGADGPHSLLGRAIGQPNRALVRARQIRIPLRRPLDAARVFLAARYPGGYGWLFPRGRQANLGCGVLMDRHRRLGALLRELDAQVGAGRGDR